VMASPLSDKLCLNLISSALPMWSCAIVLHVQQKVQEAIKDVRTSSQAESVTRCASAVP
jgi:hypothetical protein